MEVPNSPTKLLIQPRRVYGRVLYYPMCHFSRFLSRLGKRKNQTGYAIAEKVIRKLQKFGFVIEFVPEKITEE
jgi:hypothetical protein